MTKNLVSFRLPKDTEREIGKNSFSPGPGLILYSVYGISMER